MGGSTRLHSERHCEEAPTYLDRKYRYNETALLSLSDIAKHCARDTSLSTYVRE